jgi:hypothetical protein
MWHYGRKWRKLSAFFANKGSTVLTRAEVFAPFVINHTIQITRFKKKP